MRNSMVSASQYRRRHVKCLSSAPEALKLVTIIGRKSKLNSTFLVRYLRVLLLRHIVLMREEVVLAETNPLGRLIHSVVGYVIN
jgi:hypothetical protein